MQMVSLQSSSHYVDVSFLLDKAHDLHKKRTPSQTFSDYPYYARRTSEWSHRRYLYS